MVKTKKMVQFFQKMIQMCLSNGSDSCFWQFCTNFESKLKCFFIWHRMLLKELSICIKFHKIHIFFSPTRRNLKET